MQLAFIASSDDHSDNLLTLLATSVEREKKTFAQKLHRPANLTSGVALWISFSAVTRLVGWVTIKLGTHYPWTRAVFTVSTACPLPAP